MEELRSLFIKQNLPRYWIYWSTALVYWYFCVCVYLYTCILAYWHTGILLYLHTGILAYWFIVLLIYIYICIIKCIYLLVYCYPGVFFFFSYTWMRVFWFTVNWFTGILVYLFSIRAYKTIISFPLYSSSGPASQSSLGTLLLTQNCTQLCTLLSNAKTNCT